MMQIAAQMVAPVSAAPIATATTPDAGFAAHFQNAEHTGAPPPKAGPPGAQPSARGGEVAMIEPNALTQEPDSRPLTSSQATQTASGLGPAGPSLVDPTLLGTQNTGSNSAARIPIWLGARLLNEPLVGTPVALPPLASSIVPNEDGIGEPPLAHAASEPNESSEPLSAIPSGQREGRAKPEPPLLGAPIGMSFSGPVKERLTGSGSPQKGSNKKNVALGAMSSGLTLAQIVAGAPGPNFAAPILIVSPGTQNPGSTFEIGDEGASAQMAAISEFPQFGHLPERAIDALSAGGPSTPDRHAAAGQQHTLAVKPVDREETSGPAVSIEEMPNMLRAGAAKPASTLPLTLPSATTSPWTHTNVIAAPEANQPIQAQMERAQTAGPQLRVHADVAQALGLMQIRVDADRRSSSLPWSQSGSLMEPMSGGVGSGNGVPASDQSVVSGEMAASETIETMSSSVKPSGGNAIAKRDDLGKAPAKGHPSRTDGRQHDWNEDSVIETPSEPRGTAASARKTDSPEADDPSISTKPVGQWSSHDVAPPASAAPSAPAAVPTAPRVAEATDVGSPLNAVQTALAVRQVGDRIALQAAARSSNTVTIHLSPPELGDIALSVKTAGSRVDAQIAASNDNVRHAFQQNTGMLAHQLSSRGLELNSVSVGSQSAQTAGGQPQFDFHHSGQNLGQQPGTPSTRVGDDGDLTKRNPQLLASASRGMDLRI